jgi:hypothetical protein
MMRNASSALVSKWRFRFGMIGSLIFDHLGRIFFVHRHQYRAAARNNP